LAHPAAAFQLSIKFRIFEQWNFRIAAYAKKSFASAKKAAIAESDAKKFHTKVSDRVSNPIDPARRDDFQAKTSADSFSVRQDSFDCPKGCRCDL